MARSELRSNQKFKRLVHCLQLPAPYVMGLLECMWQCGYASGNDLLGDATDVEIAAEWPGEPGKLFAALKADNWIDERAGKYHIHDLADHAPDYVKKRLLRRASEADARFSAKERGLSSNVRQTADNGSQTADNGRRSGAVPNTPNPTQPITPPTPSGGTDTPSDDKPKRKPFTPPTSEDATAYGKTLALPESECRAFLDFYESKGWLVGKAKMVDWQSAMRNWNRTYRKGGVGKSSPRPVSAGYEQATRPKPPPVPTIDPAELIRRDNAERAKSAQVPTVDFTKRGGTAAIGDLLAGVGK